MSNEVKFGTAEALKAETPQWATVVFRTVILLTTVLSAWVAATNMIPEAAKFEVVLAFKGFDTLVWGLSRMFGVVKDENPVKFKA